MSQETFTVEELINKLQQFLNEGSVDNDTPVTMDAMMNINSISVLETVTKPVILLETSDPSLEENMEVNMIPTFYGFVEANEESLEVGELVVTDEGVELEVVSTNPLRFDIAEVELEDWGE